jgi:hypothetical protein
MYVHRSGSNVVNGRYWADGDPSHPIAHSMQTRPIDVAGLRRRLAALQALSVAEATQGSPLLAARERSAFKAVPRPSRRADPDSALGASLSDAAIDRLIDELSLEGYWPSELKATSNPYVGPAPAEVTPGDFSETFVGDRFDTSPYPPDPPLIGISTETYLRNMRILLAYLDATPG